jgi:hypothetical protein
MKSLQPARQLILGVSLYSPAKRRRDGMRPTQLPMIALVIAALALAGCRRGTPGGDPPADDQGAMSAKFPGKNETLAPKAPETSKPTTADVPKKTIAPPLRYMIAVANKPHMMRIGRDRESVLKTIEMTDDEVKRWTEEPAGKAEERSYAAYPQLASRPTAKRTRVWTASREADSASQAVKLTDDEIRAWAEAKNEQSVREDRAALFIHPGYVEIVYREASGELRYAVRNARSSQAGRDRESVLQTREMAEPQIRRWVEASDEKAMREARAAIFYRAGYAEILSRVVENAPTDFGN